MSERVFQFNEPHPTGGDSLVTITESQILEFMRKYRAANPDGRIRYNNDLLDEFLVAYWAWEVKDENSTKGNDYAKQI